MKILYTITLSSLLFLGCSKDDAFTTSSNAIITGIDYRFCLCYCGGYFIEIDDNTYRFNQGFPPSNNEFGVDLSRENLPMEVTVQWKLTPVDEDCSASDRITIISLKKN